jgi:hypothetical protein
MHAIKTWPSVFNAMWRGEKTFEYRKNDRGYALGDTLTLEEWDDEDGYTGRKIRATITYMLHGDFGIPDGYCVMQVKPYDWVSG